MKRTLLLLSLTLISVQFLQGQCVPDATITSPGTYPPPGSTTDTTAIILPDTPVNQAASFVTQIRVLQDTTVTLFGTTFNVPVDSLGIVSVTGLPPGMSYACDVPNCTWPGGSNGCIELSGTPNSVGVFNMVATAATRIAFGAILDTVVQTPFIFQLEVVAAASIFEERPLEFRLDPNPANTFVDIRVNRERSTVDYTIMDLLGRRMESGSFRSEDGDYRLGVDHLKNGIYLIKLSGDGYAATRRLVIQH